MREAGRRGKHQFNGLQGRRVQGGKGGPRSARLDGPRARCACTNLKDGPLWFRNMDRNRDGDVSRKGFLGSDEEFRRRSEQHSLNEALREGAA